MRMCAARRTHPFKAPSLQASVRDASIYRLSSWQSIFRMCCCKTETGSNDESGLVRSYRASQLRSRVYSMFQIMAIWHLRDVTPIITLVR
jgi:hypothetical protein